jgi:hypothetical protein
MSSISKAADLNYLVQGGGQLSTAFPFRKYFLNKTGTNQGTLTEGKGSVRLTS